MRSRHENISNSKELKRAIVAAGGVVYRKSPNGDPDFEYLVLEHRYGKYWDFPKGRRQVRYGKAESNIETAKREIREETGISNFTIINRLNNVIRYWVKRGKSIFPKEVHLFLVQFSSSVRVNLSSEHTDYRWLSYKEALRRITHETSKRVLEEANKILSFKNPE